MTPAGVTSTAAFCTVLTLLVPLSCTFTACAGYMVKAPPNYTALEGHLTATVILAPTPPSTEAPLYTWDFENSTALTANGTSDASFYADDVDSQEAEAEADDTTEDYGDVLAEPLPPLRYVNGSVDSNFLYDVSVEEEEEEEAPEESAEPLTLSLFAKGYRRAIKTYRVTENVASLSFVFPCGLVVQGGIHFFRLERGGDVLAESGEVEVAWPRVVMEVPRWLETYHSPVDVEFGFTRNICLPQSPIHFKVWVDLLYHGVPVAGPDPYSPPTTATPPGSGKHGKNRGAWTPLDDDRLRRALRKGRNRMNGQDRKEGWSRRKFTWRMKKQRRRKNRIAGVVRPDSRRGETQDNEAGAEEETEEALARAKRMMGVQPPKGTLVSSGARAGSSAWGGRAMRLERIQLPGLYARGSHKVSFLCDSIGPAGLYSVRLITNVSSSPVIASSEWFTVVWSDLFNLFIRASSITPCRGSIGVTVSYPACIGEFDKVRVFARVRANVTSADPPTVDRYLLERRVIPSRSSVVFPCSVFEIEATDFCFVYVNTAKNKAVSEVQRKCIPTYRPNVIREAGQWGQWTAWTSCTSSCGHGKRLRHRFCDSPPSRNGGDYCHGERLETTPCEGPPCGEPTRHPAPASTPKDSRCGCGCTLALPPGQATSITASAADCMGTAVWLLQAPEGEHVTAEVVWAALKPGAQWLKLRDGDAAVAPLLVRLPTDADLSLSVPSPRRHSPRLRSSGTDLLLEFRSDINASTLGLTPASWGFLVTAFPSDEAPVVDGRGDLAAPTTSYGRLLAGMHIAAVVFVAMLVAAVVVLAVYHWRRYRLYKRARLIPESPYMTPPSTPSKEVVKGSSTLTLTEVISLKSLRLRTRIPVSLPIRKRGGGTPYASVDEDQADLGPRHSLPNSPFMTRRICTPTMLRRSSSQLGRILRKGSGNFKRKKRRFASVDELETRCISPIHETQREEEGEGGKEGKAADGGKGRDEEDSAKYREYRKSLLVGDSKDLRLPPKLAKEKLNLERARRSVMSRTNSSATMRASSSASELSVNGTDTEMEYDYYDYDMDNASAVPGSLFGLDPLVLAWVPPFIPIPGEATPTNNDIPLHNLNLPQDLCASPPAPEEPARPTMLPLKYLNIPNTEDGVAAMINSVLSEEANDRQELIEDEDAGDDDDDDDVPPFALDQTPTPNNGKILNLDDIQFADESDDDAL
ncbi:uncharacterized protein LOC134776802 [Penaeus indicus]|uniref:uncharacterized protein LOC134776802 n=1 Tax=Penaeus indicus TaxID=29960 RepID=UPI00300D82C6